MTTAAIHYRFRFPGDREERFELRFDPDSLELEGFAPEEPPEWARLEFNQCSNCPLRPDEHPSCPAAANLATIVHRFEGVLSYHDVELEVDTEQRTVRQSTSAQEAVSSLVGLILATSGCPHTRHFRPMARFHLPLANEVETTYRSTSMYLLGQFFRCLAGEPIDLGLGGLKRIYAEIQVVNSALATRLRVASKSDSALNAVSLLDVHALLVPDAIEESLDDLRPAFSSFL